MGKHLSYETDVVSEDTSDEPPLLEGEQIEYEARFGVSVTSKIVAVILIFVPPLFLGWSILWLWFHYSGVKGSKIWVTKKRIIEMYHSRDGYAVTSIPMAQIKEAAIRLDPLSAIVDRIFGTFEIVIVFKGDESSLLKKIKNNLKNHRLGDVKRAKQLVKKVNALLAERSESYGTTEYTE